MWVLSSYIQLQPLYALRFRQWDNHKAQSALVLCSWKSRRWIDTTKRIQLRTISTRTERERANHTALVLRKNWYLEFGPWPSPNSILSLSHLQLLTTTIRAYEIRVSLRRRRVVGDSFSEFRNIESRKSKVCIALLVHDKDVCVVGESSVFCIIHVYVLVHLWPCRCASRKSKVGL